MNILIAPDKFKGSLTAGEAAGRIAKGLGDGFACRLIPIADGGEGTAEAIRMALGGTWETRIVPDPLGREVEASFALVRTGGERVAVIDMSAASGLWRVTGGERDPWRASTLGTGRLVRAAAELGVDRIVLGLGGSSTNDGGAGLARALGFRFLDAAGVEVTELPADLENVRRIEGAMVSLPLVEAACDVTNPLLGPSGATRVYGAQKGIREDDVARHEERLLHLADLVERDLGFAGRDLPGAGAAGGLGFGAMAFCRAEIVSGFALVARLTGLEENLAWADALITGEGSLDRQTLHGKGPHGVAALARALGKPVVAFAGRVEGAEELEAVFDLIRVIAPAGIAEAESMRRAGDFLENAARETVDWLRCRIQG